MPQQPSWFSTPDLMQLIIGVLFAAVIWFTIRTLRKIDRNQDILFKKLTTLERDFYLLQGEHRAFHGPRGGKTCDH